MFRCYVACDAEQKSAYTFTSIHAGLSSVKSIYDAVVLFLVFYHATKFFEAI